MMRSTDTSVLDVLCPMHLVVSATGHIKHAGPTIAKLRTDPGLVGQRFLEVFSLQRPRAITTMDDLRQAAQTKLHLELRDAPRTALKGIMVPVNNGTEDMILNLSFGISVIEGVRDYALTNADFAATDLAIELLYIMEANTAAMNLSRHLNMRLQGAKTAAEEQALTDTLTGLKNRRAMDATLERLLAGGGGFAVMQIDLDYFKAVNDTLGHAAGDFVLRRVAEIMLEEVRKSDTVARVGGDEFTVILPDIYDEAVLRGVGRRIIERLEVPIIFDGHECRISASIGTVWIQSGPQVSADEILSDADIALYASKHAGRAQQTFYKPELRKAANARQAPAGRGRRKEENGPL
jgi:diguanylate cyclase (GGDEF)-like protein